MCPFFDPFCGLLGKERALWARINRGGKAKSLLGKLPGTDHDDLLPSSIPGLVPRPRFSENVTLKDSGITMIMITATASLVAAAGL